jgi:hypothetical protein
MKLSGRWGAIAVSLLVVSGGAGAVRAQALPPELAEAEAACRIGDCYTAVTAVAERLRRQAASPEEVNSLLALLAAMLFEWAKEADAAGLQALAEAMAGLAPYSTDPRQIRAFQEIAEVIRRGDAVLYDLSAPFAASPA